MNLRGKFIVIDGPDGAGKGAQLERLKTLIDDLGGGYTFAKDPGGTAIGDRIRHILLGYDLREMDPYCETLLFMASRAQLAAQVIRPALAQGHTVIGDRFISATCAYQTAAGFPREQVIALGQIAVQDTWPDMTIVLDVSPEVGFARTGRTARDAARPGNGGQMDMFGDTQADAMERRPLDFHRRVREAFLELPSFYPRPVEIVDGQPDADTVFQAIREVLTRAFP